MQDGRIIIRENVPDFPLKNGDQLKRIKTNKDYAQQFRVKNGIFKGLNILASHELHGDLCWLHVSASRANCKAKIITMLDITYLKQNFFQKGAQILHVVDPDINQMHKINLWSCLDKQFLTDIPFNEVIKNNA